jgi:hypothetical protein
MPGFSRRGDSAEGRLLDRAIISNTIALGVARMSLVVLRHLLPLP